MMRKLSILAIILAQLACTFTVQPVYKPTGAILSPANTLAPVFTPIPTYAPVSIPTAKPLARVCVAGDNVWLRNEPSESAGGIVLTRGARLAVISDGGAWLAVVTGDSKIGYIGAAWVLSCR